MGRTDINRVAETVLVPILREVYGYQDLKNLNDSRGANYPAIDLGDETARIAIQVTATSTIDKVKHTLQGFIEHELHKTFDRVQVYILTEKQKTYSVRSLQAITKDKVQFDPKRDILDYQDLLEQIATFQVEQLERICNILEANFGDSNIVSSSKKDNTFLLAEPASQKPQKVYLNLLELYFPERVYLADLAIDRNQVIQSSRNTNRPLKRDSSTRDVAAAALKQHGLRFGVDWVCHEGKVITFHDLRDRDLPLVALIDLGTVTPLDSQEFYEIDDDYENIFKSLLGRCLQQKLYHLNVQWQHQERLFIFSEVDGNPKRSEGWKDKRTDNRAVYERVMKNNKPDEILHCKHFGFRTKYVRFGNKWYVSITPDWFFSFDGYRKSYFAKDNLDWLKRHENDKSVCNHLRFIAAFLKQERPSDLFTQRQQYSFLSFGNLITFDNAPPLNDKDWLPDKSVNKLSNDDLEQQMELILEL